MNKLWLLLLFVAMPLCADHWPEGVEGGLEIARDHCLNPDTDLSRFMTFEFLEAGEKVFFHVSCKVLLEHMKEVESNE